MMEHLKVPPTMIGFPIATRSVTRGLFAAVSKFGATCNSYLRLADWND